MNTLLRKMTLALAPPFYVALSRAWFGTCRLTEQGVDNLEAAKKMGGVIAPCWHYSFVYLFHHLSGYGGVVLVSASRDGEYIARIAERSGLMVVRGSSNRYGARALKQLLRAMREGRHLGIVADGSQGPRRVFQPGAVYLASRTGAPILPMAWAADRYIAVNSWDRTVIPKPFARIVLRYGEPVLVPAGLKGDGLEEYRLRLETEMNSIYEQVWMEFGRKEHDGGREEGEGRKQ